ncbi:hypothetical protein [Cytobacillus gottheilii]|uniref:hypothetical protein n=1 Tax=Cytobacillus gottheilii TaxID=859144 RepID=UPI0024956E59|nr:hypothetical protein [Cytobacillus gottheilii]
MLDIDKIRWMMNRSDSRWWEEDSWEIYTKLSNDMDDTMDFLTICSTQELETIEWELNDLMNDFSDENGEGEFIGFLEDLGERKSDSLLESVREFKVNIKEVLG